jgi:hypothetical protein
MCAYKNQSIFLGPPLKAGHYGGGACLRPYIGKEEGCLIRTLGGALC